MTGSLRCREDERLWTHGNSAQLPWPVTSSREVKLLLLEPAARQFSPILSTKSVADIVKPRAQKNISTIDQMTANNHSDSLLEPCSLQIAVPF